MIEAPTRSIQQKLCEALGLEGRKIKRININITPSDALISVVELYINKDEANELIEVLRSYELTEKLL